MMMMMMMMMIIHSKSTDLSLEFCKADNLKKKEKTKWG
jgi:hypothetical protein